MEPKTYKIHHLTVSLIRDSSVTAPARRISAAMDARDILAPFFEGLDREHMLVALLDAKHAVIGVNTVSIGTLTLSIVHPREVFKPAIVAGCAAIILAHNHPSGDPTPSAEDRELTRRLVEAGKLLGIAVLDHLVIGDNRSFVSFADRGWLNNA